MTTEKRCFMCGKTWESSEVQDPPFWGVLYDFCGVCVKKMNYEFECQFRHKVLRLEDYRKC